MPLVNFGVTPIMQYKNEIGKTGQVYVDALANRNKQRALEQARQMEQDKLAMAQQQREEAHNINMLNQAKMQREADKAIRLDTVNKQIMQNGKALRASGMKEGDIIKQNLGFARDNLLPDEFEAYKGKQEADLWKHVDEFNKRGNMPEEAYSKLAEGASAFLGMEVTPHMLKNPEAIKVLQSRDGYANKFNSQGDLIGRTDLLDKTTRQNQNALASAKLASEQALQSNRYQQQQVNKLKLDELKQAIEQAKTVKNIYKDNAVQAVKNKWTTQQKTENLVNMLDQIGAIDEANKLRNGGGIKQLKNALDLQIKQYTLQEKKDKQKERSNKKITETINRGKKELDKNIALENKLKKALATVEGYIQDGAEKVSPESSSIFASLTGLASTRNPKAQKRALQNYLKKVQNKIKYTDKWLRKKGVDMSYREPEIQKKATSTPTKLTGLAGYIKRGMNNGLE